MTLPIGYGDGYKRSLSNKAYVLVRGARAPVIGLVCMDQIMADVTDIEGARMGDEVVLLGGQMNDRITPDEMALWADTIPYEIMLGFAPRQIKLTVQR
jgi:alanine racemase